MKEKNETVNLGHTWKERESANLSSSSVHQSDSGGSIVETLTKTLIKLHFLSLSPLLQIMMTKMKYDDAINQFVKY